MNLRTENNFTKQKIALVLETALNVRYIRKANIQMDEVASCVVRRGCDVTGLPAQHGAPAVDSG